jgi:iron complex outermembrane receptor protein
MSSLKLAGFGAAALLAATADASVRIEELSLEQLSDVVITSVSKREEALASAAASVYVITGEDIRRSGATTLPEALRLAPNLQVARADANQYAITARGFNNTLANRLLVLIDGRIVYSPLFSGVFWEVQDVVLEDVQRIEVISGPGGTLWGQNAVNGVINVITKAAADTQGLMVSAGGGNRQRAVTTRYGGTLGGGGHYRAYAKYFDQTHSKQGNGAGIMDESALQLA